MNCKPAGVDNVGTSAGESDRASVGELVRCVPVRYDLGKFPGVGLRHRIYLCEKSSPMTSCFESFEFIPLLVPRIQPRVKVVVICGSPKTVECQN